MNKIFFTSDLHFGHKNIIKYENRPYSSIEDMDEGLIGNWNSVVGKDDHIYIIGDFSFYSKDKTLEILKKLNGKKYLILGNHDKVITKNEELRSQFLWVKDYYVLNYKGFIFVLFHYPIFSWDRKHYGSIHLYGHVHRLKDINTSLNSLLLNAFNVGIDVNGGFPIEINEIINKYKYKHKECE